MRCKCLYDLREILAESIPGIHLSSKLTACNYLYPFSSYILQMFCERTDGHWLNRFFLLRVQGYMFNPLYPKLLYLFFILEIGIKITVWCGVWAGDIIGPYFFRDDQDRHFTVNGNRSMITEYFWHQLNDMDNRTAPQPTQRMSPSIY